MRMARALSVLLAVLCAAAVADDVGDGYGNSTRVRRTPYHHTRHSALADDELDAMAAWKRAHWQETQQIMRHENSEGHVECCPSMVELVLQKGGRTRQGLFVELWEEEGRQKQIFYEVSCRPDVVDKPCRFIDARLYNQSRCVQAYSYSYALVRHPEVYGSTTTTTTPPPSGTPPGWSLDYIRVRSGCQCQITPKKKRNPHMKKERHRPRKRNKKFEEDQT